METWPRKEVTKMEGNSLASHLIFYLYANISLDVRKAFTLTKSEETFLWTNKSTLIRCLLKNSF